MSFPIGQPIYFAYKEDEEDGSTPTEFGYTPDYFACSNIDYTQVIGQDDVMQIQYDTTDIAGQSEIQNGDFSSVTGWLVNGDWNVNTTFGYAQIANATTDSTLVQDILSATHTGYSYKVSIAAGQIDGDVELTFGFDINGDVNRFKVSEGLNEFYIDMIVGSSEPFFIRAYTGASAIIYEVNMYYVFTDGVMTLWSSPDSEYEGELQYSENPSDVSVERNAVIYKWDFDSLSKDDGCYYFTYLNGRDGVLIGQTGVFNGYFNIGNPAIYDMYGWVKDLKASSTIIGGDGVCTYTSGGLDVIDNTSTATSSTSLDMGYSYEVEVSIISNTGITLSVFAGDDQVDFVGTGVQTGVITPLFFDQLEMQFTPIDGNPGRSVVVDYIKCRISDATRSEQTFTNNASNIFKLGTHFGTHKIEACGLPGLSDNYKMSYRLPSKIAKTRFSGSRDSNRLSTGDRFLTYADGVRSREFTTTWIPSPEFDVIFLLVMAKVFKIDGVRYWILTELDEIEPQYPANEDEHASIMIEITGQSELFENKNCSGEDIEC